MWIGAAIFYVTLTLVFTYPQALSLSSVPDHHDALFSIWRLEWIAHQLANDPAALFQANIFYPAARTLANSDATLLQGALAAPLLWCGVPGVVAYNLLVLSSFVLSGMTAFLVVSSLTGSARAGLLSGSIAAFAPFRFDHYCHLELLFGFWVPPALFLMHNALSTRARGPLWGVVLCVAAQFYSCIYFGVFLGTLLVAWLFCLLAFRAVRIDWFTTRRLCVIALLSATVLVPYAMPYFRNSVDLGVRSNAEAASYSAHLLHYLTSPPDNVLYGWTFSHWGLNERTLFPGAVALTLSVLAIARKRQPLTVGFFILFLLALDISLGANGFMFPFLRKTMPLYAGLRVPARAAGLVLSLTAILAGYGAVALFTSTSVRRTRHGGQVLFLLVLAVVLGEYAHRPLRLVRLQTAPDVVQMWLSQQPTTVILELPVPRSDRLPGHEAWFQFRSIFHWQNLANGYSGFYPQTYLRLLDALQDIPDSRSLDAIGQHGIRLLLVHERFYDERDRSALRLALRARRDFEPVGTFPSRAGSVAIYRVLDRTSEGLSHE